MTVENRVAKGARFLDLQYPGWFEKINPETLELRGSNSCILGKCYGDYATGLRRLKIWGTGKQQTFGFTENFLEVIEWDGLKNAWLKEIETRKKWKSVPVAEPVQPEPVE